MQTNDPSQPTVTLTCAGEILESALVEPAQINFGAISRSQPLPIERKIVIQPASAGPITPKLREFNIPGLEAKLEEVDPGRKWELTATLKDPNAVSRVRGELVIETGVAQAPDLRLNVFGMLAPRVVTEPRSIIVPQNRAADWSTRVRLTWDGPEAGTITSASSQEPGVKVALEEKEGGKQEVVVSLEEGFKPTPRGYAVVLETSDKDMPRILVPMRFMELTAAARRAVPSTSNRKPDPAEIRAPASAGQRSRSAAAQPAAKTADSTPPKKESSAVPPE